MPRGLIYICLIAALLYVLFPRDLVPDFLVGWGWLDDALIVFLLWRFFRRQRERRQTRYYSPTQSSRCHRRYPPSRK